MHLPRMMLTAPASGSGKTLITCGILQALVNRGLKVSSFKCGPDYIDPMFHAKVIGTKSKNLDTFFTEEKVTKYLFGRTAKETDISVVEGVMGYYDGLGGISSKASSYDVAKTLEIPTVLIVNGKGMSLSVLALIKGFLEFEEPRMIQGVILNQISPMIYGELKTLIEERLQIKVYGYVPLREDLALESRHLGLVMPEEILDLKEKLMLLAEELEKSLDLDGLITLCERASDLEIETPVYEKVGGNPCIAVAKDEAFCFTYEDNLSLIEKLGGKLVEFSPLKDKKLPENIQGILLSGGYPELYAKELSENQDMLTQIQEAIQMGMPCIAECGGFLYLHRELEGSDGKVYPMANIIDAKAYATSKLGRFGYITLSANRDNLLLKKGEEIRGHEFHYWDSEENGDAFHAQKPLRKKNWECIHSEENLLAGFPHLFYYSNPKAVKQFLEKCEDYQCLSL